MIVVVGLSHKTAPVEIRERLALSGDALKEAHLHLQNRGELRESLFLSTCNRVEVFAVPESSRESAFSAIRHYLATLAGDGVGHLEDCLYEKSGDEAVRHIFRVSASLDSMVLGEPQILGQVKQAYDLALGCGSLGSYLGRCLSRAFAVAKRVRTETALGEGTVSISSVAVDLAKSIFGDLAEQTVLLVGAGEMAEAAAKSLGRGARAIRVCNRSFERGATLAEAFGADVARWEHLEQELTHADVVVTSTASPTYVITRDLVRRVMRARRGRTLFIIDISVPRNVEPQVHEMDNVYVYNVDDLEQQVAEGLKLRQNEVEAAERIVAVELKEFETWAKGLHVQPTIVALRARARSVYLAELERTLAGRLRHLPESDRAALKQMVESTVNKLLHGPTTRLRDGSAGDVTEDLAGAVRYLFELGDSAPPSSNPRLRARPHGASAGTGSSLGEAFEGNERESGQGRS